MSSSCIEDVSVPDDDWYRITSELLNRAGITINGTAPADIRVNNPDFYKRVLQEGSLGLGESYMDGWWECDRLDMFFTQVLRAGLEGQLPRHFKDTLRIAAARLFNLQNKKRAWVVGKEHYDLGNDLFTRMLDPYMQYSCAYWKDATTLESAQQAKLNMIAEKLQLKPGMRVLDSRNWHKHGVKGWMSLFCLRITATCTIVSTALSPLACLSMWVQKTTTPILMLSIAI